MRPYALLTALLLGTSLLAQTPEAFNYQGVARDAGGDALANTAIGVQFQLHQGTAVGTVVYSETHSPTTNDLGLFSLEVGNGTPGTGTFAAIDWSAGPYFLEVGLDPTGGSSYVSVGTQQLLSVPYALHAKTADMADDGDWVLSGDTVHSNGRRVGIGTSTPSQDLDVEGTFQLKDGTQADKRILTSDGDGNASWQDFSAESLLGVGNVPPTGLSCLGIAGSLGIGPYPQAMTVLGDYAYVVDRTTDDLKVIDISDLSNPMLTGSLGLGPEPTSVAVSGGYAYVVDLGSDDLKVIDVSIPSNPVLIGSPSIGPGSWSISVSGDHLYVVDIDLDALVVIDISDPASPVSVGSLGIGSNATSIAVSGMYAYVVDSGSDDLKVIDISNPASPVLSGSLAIGTAPWKLAVSGNYAYVVDYESIDLKVIDISDPASPAFSGSLSIGTTTWDLFVSGNYAYVVDSNSDDLRVIDISDPASPVLSGSLLIGPDPRTVAVSGNHAYVADAGSADLKVIELFCPSAQQQLAYDPVTGTLVAMEGWQVSADTLHNGAKRVGIGTASPDTTLHVAGKLKYQDGTQADKRILTSDADGNASWQELSAAGLLGAGNVPPAFSDDLSCLGIAGSVGVGPIPTSMTVSGSYAYVVDLVSGDLKVIDISSPASPVISGSLGIGTLPTSVAVSGNYAYVVAQIPGDLKVIDISSPASPVLSGSLGVGSSPASVAVSGNYAYVVGQGTGDLKVIDISNPSSPVLSGSLVVGGAPVFVAVSGNYAYVVGPGTGNLKVIDVSSPANPVLSGSLGVGPAPACVAVSGNYAYVVDYGTDDLKVIDISSPATPTLIGSMGIGTSPLSLVVSGNYAYVVDTDTDDLKVIDISSPASPVLSSSLLIGPDPRSVAVLGNYAYMVDQGSDDLKVVELFCPTAQQQLTYDPSIGAFVAVGGWQLNADTLYTLDKKVGIGISDPNSLLAGTDLGLVDDAGEHARLTMKSNAVMGVLDTRSTPGAERMQLGSVSAHPLSFFTSGALQMTLDTNGFLGIGTATPAHGLDLRADGQAFGHRSLDSTIAIGTYVDNTYGAFLQTHTDHPLQFATNNGDAQMTLLQNGNLGIGTTAPSAQLDVRDASASEFRLSLSSSHWAKFRFSASEGLRIEAKNEGNEFRPMLLIGSELRFMSGVGTTPERMRLASNGYLGIGTTTPVRPLHVTQGSGNPNVVLVEATGSPQAYLRFNDANTTTNANQPYIGSQGDAFTINTGGAEAIRVEADKDVQVNGYTKLGTDAPAIKIKEFTGTTNATQGGTTAIDTGIPSDKVISVDVWVQPFTNVWLPPSTNSPSAFRYYLLGNFVYLITVSGASADVVDEAYRVIVTYKE